MIESTEAPRSHTILCILSVALRGRLLGVGLLRSILIIVTTAGPVTASRVTVIDAAQVFLRPFLVHASGVPITKDRNDRWSVFFIIDDAERNDPSYLFALVRRVGRYVFAQCSGTRFRCARRSSGVI